MTTTDPAAPDLTPIEAHADAATPGPWHVEPGLTGYPQRICNDAGIIVGETYTGPEHPPVDADFIAGARTYVPTLLAEVTRLRAELAAVRAALTVQPCHITGMHTPDHHTESSCSYQRAATLDRVLAVLGTTYDDLPRELHDDCHWCRHVPNQEQYRERLRRSYRWAGVEIPAELAELAPDAPRPGDPELVLPCVTGEWRLWSEVAADAVKATGLNSDRVGAALVALTKTDLVEARWESSMSKLRLRPVLPAGDQAAEAVDAKASDR